MKANKLVLKFWANVKKNDDIRIAGQQAPDFDEAVVNIPYIKDGHVLHQLNVYRPKGVEGKLPVILDIHGGGWYAGDKELNEYFCRALTKYGFAVVDISYRLSPECDVFEQVRDVFKAIEFTVANADEYGLDVDNFFIAGDSAGGHIAGIVINAVKDEKLREVFGVGVPVDIRGAGLICPAADPLKIAPLPKSFMKFYFEPVFGKGYLKTDRINYVSYFNILQKDVCPVFFITCKGDFLRKQTRAAYEATKAQGTPTELFDLLKPYTSGHKLAHVFNVLHWEWDEAEAANRAMCDFFKAHMKNQPE